jgi:ribosomal protein S18 acetylase RimI-like enzyme
VPRADKVARAFAEREPSDEAVVLVVEDGGTVVGFVDVRMNRTPDWNMLRRKIGGWVSELGVAETHRGRGVGSRLLQAAEEWLGGRGVEILMLDTGWRNEEAIRFYEQRMGYRRIGLILIKELGTNP